MTEDLDLETKFHLPWLASVPYRVQEFLWILVSTTFSKKFRKEYNISLLQSSRSKHDCWLMYLIVRDINTFGINESIFSLSGFSSSTDMRTFDRHPSFIAFVSIHSICWTALSIFRPSKWIQLKGTFFSKLRDIVFAISLVSIFLLKSSNVRSWILRHTLWSC